MDLVPDCRTADIPGDSHPNLWHAGLMRFWRDIIADRYSAGLLGVLLTLAFVIQVMVAGWANAAMLAPDPTEIICTSSPNGVHQPAGPSQKHDCPCSLLCGAGVHLQTVLSPSDGTGAPVRFAEPVVISADTDTGMRPAPADERYHARAPPISLMT